MRKEWSTFDIVVEDEDMHKLLCLIHVVHRHVYNDFDDLKRPMASSKNLDEMDPNKFFSTEQNRMIDHQRPPAFMSIYKILKFKMKVSYQRWLLNLKMGRLLHMAIYKTIVQR